MTTRGSGTVGPSPNTPEALAAVDGEQELIASVLRGDRKAAARLVSTHIDAVYGFVRLRLVPRADLVDDVVQDVFLAALNGLTTFHQRSSLRTWLIGIARHKVEDVYRQRLRSPEALEAGDDVEPEWSSATADLDEQIDAVRVRSQTRRVLAQLPEHYALVLLWRYWEQRSTREMAAAIGASEKSVERTLARARARFRELWEQQRRPSTSGRQ